MEEPDFERRMAVFKRVREVGRGEAQMAEMELGAVAYNCCFYLRHETDSSLKTNALEALLSVCRVVGAMAEAQPEVARGLVERVLLAEVRAGIRHKEDVVRCDFVAVLQALVTQCQAASARCRDLAALADIDTDLDFWENMKHVQLHRRGRAMARLARSLRERAVAVRPRNLQQLVLPLATVCLLSDTFAKNSDLVDQAIDLVGAVNGALPWPMYENNVKYYLEMFAKDATHQKQLVKIVTAILDGFHFNLNKELEHRADLGEEKVEEAPGVVETGRRLTKPLLGQAAEERPPVSKEEALRLKIFNTVNNVLLPKLNATLSGKTKGPTNISDEDKLILRVPLALPVVKMLRLISPKLLQRAVPGILNRIAGFLKSKAVEIREAARATLGQVMEELGPRSLLVMVRELQTQLTRGYQLHVLTFTLHFVLHKLATLGLLKAGDLDPACALVVATCVEEVFGAVAEEKEVAKITGKLLEARGTKSYDTLQLLATYVSNAKLMEVVRPVADKCAALATFKSLVKVRECFRHLVLGLLANTGLDPLHALVFVYGVTTDKLKIGNTGVVQRNGLKASRKQESIYIVQPAPRRQGELSAKTSKSASQHIIHEFGLSLLHFLLKRSSLVPSEEHCARLDPFLPILLSFLSSSHVTLITASLKCLLWLLKFPLASLDSPKVMEFTNKVFDLLNKFGAGTDGKGENHDLVVIASKLLVVLIRDVSLTQLDANHLKTVLDYVVTDVMDPFKATTAFGLLGAIVQRKLVSEELHEVVLRMVELSVRHDSGQTRAAARAIVTAYVANYALKKKLGKLLDVYAGQLGYEAAAGRAAAALALGGLVVAVGAARVEQHTHFLFLSLAPRLVNDEAPEVRRAVARAIGELVKTAPQGSVEKVVASTLTWLQASSEPEHAQLACHLLTVFLDTLGTSLLLPHLPTVLPHLALHLASTSDHLVLQALHLATRLARLQVEVGVVVWRAVHPLLLHPHAWARLLACQLVGLPLAACPPSPAAMAATGAWLASPDILRSLLLDLLEQLGLATEAAGELPTQVLKNLVAVARATLVEGWAAVEGAEVLSFPWLVRKAVKVANQELVNEPKVTARRTLVFSLVAAVCLEAGEEQVLEVLDTILPPLLRELANPHTDPELKSHSQEVVELLKSRVDVEVFSAKYLEVQLNLAKKKNERAAQKKQNYISDPKLAAKRKIQQNEAKKRAKKAKVLAQHHGKPLEL